MLHVRREIPEVAVVSFLQLALAEKTADGLGRLGRGWDALEEEDAVLVNHSERIE
jgi:hypothetical protein